MQLGEVKVRQITQLEIVGFSPLLFTAQGHVWVYTNPQVLLCRVLLVSGVLRFVL